MSRRRKGRRKKYVEAGCGESCKKASNEYTYKKPENKCFSPEEVLKA